MPLSLVLNSSATKRTRIMFCTSLKCTDSLISLIFLIVFAFAPTSKALANGSCSLEMGSRAESLLIDALSSWPALLKHQRIFASCDDGALGEGYSDAVVHLFSQKWDQFGDFAALAKKHPAFRRWAIRHIDASASDEDLKRIIRNATICNDEATMKSLCKTIRQAASDALSESAQMRR